MPPLLKFITKRIFAALFTLFILTILLYGTIAITPIEMRVALYMPDNINLQVLYDHPQAIENLKQRIIEEHNLNAPFPVQYIKWVTSFFTQNWGYSPSLKQEVLPALMLRAPATAELAIFSLILLIPLSLFCGIAAAANKEKVIDYTVRLFTLGFMSIPLFILALFLLAIFYVSLKWFSLGGMSHDLYLLGSTFRSYTGLMTVDGLLNQRFDLVLKTLQHLTLPVITLVFSQWALLTRITRTALIEELKKEYILSAKAKGASEHTILWDHALKNALGVFLSNTALSAASFVTGVFVVERIFLWPGISDMALRSGSYQPDAPAVMGFTVYSVMVVLLIMLFLDILQVIINPYISREALEYSNAR